MAKQPTAVSKMMTHAGALAACDAVWEEFRRLAVEGAEKKLASLEETYKAELFQVLPPEDMATRESNQPREAAAIKAAKDCLSRIPGIIDRYVRIGRANLERAMLPQERKRKTGPVDKRSGPPKVPRVRRPKVPKPKKVSKGKGGRPRHHKGSLRRRREKNRAILREQRDSSAGNNFVREVRGWAPYPSRRKAKVPGWRKAFADGQLFKGTRGRYAHGPKRIAQE